MCTHSANGRMHEIWEMRSVPHNDVFVLFGDSVVRRRRRKYRLQFLYARMVGIFLVDGEVSPVVVFVSYFVYTHSPTVDCNAPLRRWKG